MRKPKQTLIGLKALIPLQGMAPHSPSSSPKFFPLEYLIVGGGAGGISSTSPVGKGAGSGGGGVDIGTLKLIRGTYTVTVAASAAANTSGNDTFVVDPTGKEILRQRGGGRGGKSGQWFADDGGCGGGAAVNPNQTLYGSLGDTVNSRYGNRGSEVRSVNSADGAGGGAGQAGVVSPSSGVGARGGEGRLSDFDGTPTVYGSGSGAAGYNEFSGTAQIVGVSGTNAGASTQADTAAGNGVANTGSAGGSAGENKDTVAGAAGGTGASGKFAVRYPGDTQLLSGGTVTFISGWVVHTFNSSGSLVIP